MRNTETNAGSFAPAKLQAKMRSILAIILATVIVTAMAGCPTPDDGGDGIGEITLTGIEVTTMPAKTVYALNEELDTRGIVVTATYSDRSKEVIDNSKLRISGYDKTRTGFQSVAVVYQGKIAYFSVSNNVKSVESIRVTAPPAKTRYNLGENLDLDGMVVMATYEDRSKAVVTTYTISGYNKDQRGNQAITVSYSGKTAEFSVNVVDTSLSTVNTPTASVPSTGANLPAGMIFNGTNVTLYTSTSGAEIWYTTNGSVPKINGADSFKYESPFPITPPVTVKAISFRDNMNDSNQLEAEYTAIPATELALNTWVDGDILTSSDEQWFKFTATAAVQFIHVSFGAQTINSGLTVYVYDSNGANVGDQGAGLYTNISRTVTEGAVYYIKVRPMYSNYSGTYRIAFNTDNVPPGANSLILNAWTDGNLPQNGEQWFRFTATANPQYIHADFGTLDYFNVQVYDAEGYTVGSQTSLNSGTRNISRNVTAGETYYVRVWYGNSGTYQLALGDSSTAPKVTIPTSGAITLTGNRWADGNIPTSTDVQWFKFTATAAAQYILINSGTLPDLYVQLYDSDGYAVGNRSNNASNYRNVTEGAVYYIKAVPASSSNSGTYQIAFNADGTAPLITIPSNAAELELNKWTEGNITSATTAGAQWFRFTATADTQYIYADSVTLGNVYVQLYDSDGEKVGSQTQLYNSSVIQTVTNGSVYYIKVWPYSSSYSGTYTIAIADSSVSSAIKMTFPSNAIQLTENTWSDGNLATTTAVQWFKFTATADSQYIHASFGTLNSGYGVYVQLYEPSGDKLGTQTRLASSPTYTSQAVTEGQVYHIRVSPYGSISGTYKIGFNATFYTPGVTPTALTLNTWADGNLATYNDVQWFKFTATGSYYHYIHGGPNSYIYVQVYNSSGASVLNQTYLNNTYNSNSSYTEGAEYYIRVTPSSAGAYKLAFADTSSQSNIKVTLPSNPSALYADTWADGNIPTGNGEQWYKFNATAYTQYIHVNSGTLNYLYVQLYNSSGNTVGSQTYINSDTRYVSHSVTLGQVYYIRVWPYSSSYSGTYRITFNTARIPPGVIPLSEENAWTEGNLPTWNSEQWFKFTATGNEEGVQYIHAIPGSVNYLRVQVFNSSGNAVGDEAYFYYYSSSYISLDVTEGEVYYIRVRPNSSSYSGSYTIAFSTSANVSDVKISLPSNAAQLTENKWANGNLSTSTTVQWFKFTATVTGQQYIHASFGTLNTDYGVYVQVYDSEGGAVGNQTQLYRYTSYTNRNVTVGEEYYIRVTPYSSYTGTYKIAFNTVWTPAPAQ